MQTRRKIVLDRLIAQPAALGLNVVARLLGRILRRNHSLDPESVRCVAVAKFVGMGSILQATPLVRALRARFPAARLVFVTAEANRPLLAHLEGVDEAIFVSDRNPAALLASTARALVSLVRQRADLYFDLEIYSAYASVVALASLARLRFGFYRTSARFKAGIYTHLIYFNTQRPVRELYLHLGRAAGVAEDSDLGLARPLVSDAARRSFAAKWRELAGARAGAAPVVINPNASDLLEERRWPAAHVRATVEALVARGHTVALTGAADERAYVGALVESLSPAARQGVIDTAGRFDLGELLALMESAACVITNDSGPMHMAIALERPTVCLFGPGDPAHYGTSKPNVAILYAGVLCSPCLYHTDTPPCAGDNVCMKRIEPVEVLAAVGALLAPPGAAAPAPRWTSWSAARAARVDSAGGPLGLMVRDSVLADVRPCECCGRTQFRFLFRRFGLRFIHCVACGLERVDPRPEGGVGYERDYYDAAWGLGEDPERVRVVKQATFRRHLTNLIRPLPYGARVLDCGAATGFFMEVAAGAGLDPYGVEVSGFGANAIALRFGAERVFHGEVAEAAFPALGEGVFDAAFLLDVLEHLRDPLAALLRLRRLLAPQGIVFITTPDTASPSRRIMGSRWTHYKAEHLFYFSAANLGALLARAGFRVAGARRARKMLSLRYVQHQFATYPHWLLTPAADALVGLAPNAADRPLPLPSGEIEIQALREDAAGG